MKRNTKRRHPFVLLYYDNDSKGEQQTYFVDMLQSPKVPERYAWLWALKKVRDWFRASNIPFEEWTKYVIYPVDRFNCSQFDETDDNKFYDHIHCADNVPEDDLEMVKWYNEIRSKYKPQLK